MIKYRPTTLLPLLLSYLLLGVIPSQGAKVDDKNFEYYWEESSTRLTYTGKGDFKKAVEKLNRELILIEGYIRQLCPNPRYDKNILGLIFNNIRPLPSHLDLTKAKNLNSFNDIDLKFFEKFTILSLPSEEIKWIVRNKREIRKRLKTIKIDLSAINNMENIKNCVRSLLKLDLDLLIKEIELPESFEDNCPNEFAKLKNQGWKPNPKRNGEKIISLIEGLKNRTVDEKAIIKRTIEQLIKEGADVNAKNEVGRSPLYYALKNGDMELAKFLIREGADVKTKDLFECNLFHLISGKRLSSLSEKQRIDMAKILIGKGVNINSQEKWGETPLHFALRSEYTELAKSFIGNGASMNVEDNQGRTPRCYISNKKNSEMIKLWGENDTEAVTTDNNISLYQAEIIRDISLITKR